jgi:hypothetical protein
MVPAALVSELPAEQAQAWADRTWTDLGLPAADVVTARAGGYEAHYVVNVATEAKASFGGIA